MRSLTDLEYSYSKHDIWPGDVATVALCIFLYPGDEASKFLLRVRTCRTEHTYSTECDCLLKVIGKVCLLMKVAYKILYIPN